MAPIEPQQPKPNKLDSLAQEASVVIFETETKAPFKAFHTKLTINPTLVTITIPKLLSKEEYPIPIGFISGASVYKSLLFASLTIEVFRHEKPPIIKFLKILDARMARRYILALVACRDNKIDLTKYSILELREQLKKIGRVEKWQKKDDSIKRRIDKKLYLLVANPSHPSLRLHKIESKYVACEINSKKTLALLEYKYGKQSLAICKTNGKIYLTHEPSF